MKKRTIAFLLTFYFLSVFTALGQSRPDVFKASVPLTWLGVDFSELKFIGPASGWGTESTKSPTEMRDTYFNVWNDFIEKEPKNFKLDEATGRRELDYATDIARKVNAKANKKEIFSESAADAEHLEEKDIQRMVKQYDCKGKTGIGFVLIAESMNKPREQASYWVTFIDMKTNTVLFTRRVTGEASGFGFRNYWLGSIKNVLKEMKKEFKHWQ